MGITVHEKLDLLLEQTAPSVLTEQSVSASYHCSGYGDGSATLTFNSNVIGITKISIQYNSVKSALKSLTSDGKSVFVTMTCDNGSGSYGTITVTAIVE